jgi:hypothetical protein
MGLFGDYNPAGRLPVTFVKSMSQLPDFGNYNMKGRPYRFMKKKPLLRRTACQAHRSEASGAPRAVPA